MVLNPTWTIPPGILVKDKLPVIKRDPGYLKRNNIRVIDSAGREVNPHSVDWSRYSGGRLPPYQLRQDPGDDNALGLVKIMFPNPYLVYLHDTPSKSLFDKDERIVQLGLHPRREGLRARRAGAERSGALEPRRDRRGDRARRRRRR